MAGKKGKSCRAGASPAASVPGGAGVPPAAVKKIHYPNQPERIVSPFGRKSPLDGLVLEENGNLTTETQRTPRNETLSVCEL